MTDPGEQLMRRIEAIDTAAADNARAAEAYQRVTEELAEATGTATSPDGVVTVVARADGSVERVTFGDGVQRIAPGDLSASVTHTIAQARYAAARAQAEIVRRGFGDSELLDRVLEADAHVFGDRRPADPGPPPMPQGPPPGAPSGQPWDEPADRSWGQPAGRGARRAPEPHGRPERGPFERGPSGRHRGRHQLEPEPEDYSQLSYLRHGR
ncbi:YbaB/EbfC family nucleoid-associated protein [Prauserella rugosa]|uniref:YbaB/EbfC DNA-binding family protein n=1 Tax=Prauserella rugosa TaxID=43354 RepID=A0A660C805_9PSEU|nr:YbaB/EbfC family nucleoid-associated protein [Prauserella rugosa]TWH18514.1 YbaB/EbfC DNA-binding family protein [Prauserella rugosa]